MSEPAPTGMTVDEFLRWEDGTDTRYELVGGAMAELYDGIPLPEPRPSQAVAR